MTTCDFSLYYKIGNNFGKFAFIKSNENPYMHYFFIRISNMEYKKNVINTKRTRYVPIKNLRNTKFLNKYLILYSFKSNGSINEFTTLRHHKNVVKMKFNSSKVYIQIFSPLKQIGYQDISQNIKR